ncbi:hypothetical protein COCON_G00070510 [Conger conger]|uniref:Uncharacterized protein n=1 Tax=Conger conger TaxID=82655 RepID=A0A9Q1DT72_CONCO|nr:hypothetical protein COCON_G00070510 [Conger conger]
MADREALKRQIELLQNLINNHKSVHGDAPSHSGEWRPAGSAPARGHRGPRGQISASFPHGPTAPSRANGGKIAAPPSPGRLSQASGTAVAAGSRPSASLAPGGQQAGPPLVSGAPSVPAPRLRKAGRGGKGADADVDTAPPGGRGAAGGGRSGGGGRGCWRARAHTPSEGQSGVPCGSRLRPAAQTPPPEES